MNQLYSYRGNLSHKIVDELLSEVKKILNIEIQDKLLARKAYVVCVECVENMNRHEDDSCEESSFSNFLSVEKEDEKLLLVTENLVSEMAKVKLENTLVELSNCKNESIKQLRLEQLKFGNFSEKGGASIGIFDVFLNAKSVSYNFEENGNGYYYYKLKAELNS